jgi:hypothetical protein
MGWIQLAQATVKWRVLVSAVLSPSNSSKRKQFLDQLNDCQLHKKGSSSCTELTVTSSPKTFCSTAENNILQHGRIRSCGPSHPPPLRRHV